MCRLRSSIIPQPDEDGYQIFLGPLKEDAPLKMVSTGKGRCTCPFFHPEREVDLVCIDAPLSQHRGRADQGPGVQPDGALSLGVSRIDGHFHCRSRRQEPEATDGYIRI